MITTKRHSIASLTRLLDHRATSLDNQIKPGDNKRSQDRHRRQDLGVHAARIGCAARNDKQKPEQRTNAEKVQHDDKHKLGLQECDALTPDCVTVPLILQSVAPDVRLHDLLPQYEKFNPLLSKNAGPDSA